MGSPQGYPNSQPYSSYSASPHYSSEAGGNFCPSPPWSGRPSWAHQGSYDQSWEESRASRQEAQMQDMASAIQGIVQVLQHKGWMEDQSFSPARGTPCMAERRSLYEDGEGEENEEMSTDGQQESGSWTYAAKPKKKARKENDGSSHQEAAAGAAAAAPDAVSQSVEAGGPAVTGA